MMTVRDPKSSLIRSTAVACLAVFIVVTCGSSVGSAPSLDESPSAEARRTPEVSPSSAPAGSLSTQSTADAVAALDLATRFETARAEGRFAEAWALLADGSQHVIGGFDDFETVESAYNAASGTEFSIDANE
jgi:hypothetical protein